MTVAEYCIVAQASCSTPSINDNDDFYNETYMCDSDTSAFTDDDDDDDEELTLSDSQTSPKSMPKTTSLSCQKTTDGNDSGNAEW